MSKSSKITCVIITSLLLLTGMKASSTQLDVNAYLDLWDAQLSAINTVDVKYCILQFPDETLPDSWLEQFTFSSVLDGLNNLSADNNPLKKCEFVMVYHYVRDNIKEFIERTDYHITDGNANITDGKIWWNAQNPELCTIYYSYDNQVELNVGGINRAVYETYENFIYYNTLGKSGKMVRLKLTDAMRNKIVNCTESDNTVNLTSQFDVTGNATNVWAETTPGETWTINVVLSKDYGYLPVELFYTYKPPNGNDRYSVRYKKLNDSLCFPIRILQRSTGSEHPVLNSVRLLLVDETSLKVNEPVSPDVFDYTKHIPVGCWIHDALKDITYVYGRPEEGLK